MHRIDTSTAQVDKFGAGKNGFTGGNPQTGELPTALDADFFDSVQEEISAVIESSGVALDKSKKNQLVTAIKALVNSGRLLNIQIFVINGQYAPTPGTKKIIVEAISGGGGSRSGSTASGQTGGSTPGYHGQYNKSRFDISAILTPLTVTVGAGGTAGNYGGGTYFGPYMSLGGGNPADGTLSAAGAGVAGSAYHRTSAENTSTGFVLSSSQGESLSSPVIQVSAGTACGFSAVNSPFPGGWQGRGADGVYASASTSYTGKTGNPGMVIVWEYA
ncbi:hypothetical protein [Pantoea septica]|uniref:hypothetical protein n=1 Tax=Pantoea septica TaxID=472695 RepID=UPI0028AB3897|nr:hypothetical protein [Pantoea septica]